MKNPTSEQQVRDMLNSYAAAVRTLDLDRIMAHYAPDVVAYDAVMQLEFAGREAYKAHWKMCLEHCQHMVFEPRTPAIVASDELAAGHCLIRCGGTGPDGKESNGWVRASFVMQKRDGRWLITHEHYSVPFDPMTEKILGQLEPQAARPVGAA